MVSTTEKVPDALRCEMWPAPGPAPSPPAWAWFWAGVLWCMAIQVTLVIHPAATGLFLGGQLLWGWRRSRRARRN